MTTTGSSSGRLGPSPGPAISGQGSAAGLVRSTRMRAVERRRSAGKQERKCRHDYPRLVAQIPAQTRSDPAVQQSLPAVARDQFREHDRQCHIGALAVQRFDVTSERHHDRAIRREDDLKREVVSSRAPVLLEALGLCFVRADMDRQHRLAEGRRVCERTHARAVKRSDRHGGGSASLDSIPL